MSDYKEAHLPTISKDLQKLQRKWPGMTNAYRPAMSRPRILVVEDNPRARELLVLLLEHEHFDVMEAATGGEALDRVNGEQFDLIFLDLGLPAMTGDEVVRRIKADPCTARIPIIVNTAFDPDATIVKDAIAAGADQVLYKPADFKNLLPVARRLVDTRH